MWSSLEHTIIQNAIDFGDVEGIKKGLTKKLLNMRPTFKNYKIDTPLKLRYLGPYFLEITNMRPIF